MLNRTTIGKSRGVVLPLVALALVVLLGFGGLVIDLGGLFVAKTELQSALDSCSLAAAHELDGAADALTRATNAGLTAGNVNKVKYQKSAVGIAATDITFSDTLAGSYSASFTPVANAKYAKCTHSTSGISSFLIQLVGAASTHSVGAVAVATRAPAQSTCPLPIALKARPGCSAPNWGFQPGEWVTMLFDPTKSDPSEMGWYNLDGSTNANETKDEVLNGYCGSKVGDTLGTPGAKVGVNDEWNSRFGIYKNNGDMANWRPDLSGYVYTSTNWKNPPPTANVCGVPASPTQNAYDSTPAFGSDPTAAKFKTKRLAYANYADTGTTVGQGDAITGLNMNPGGFHNVATSGSGGEIQQYGENKRIVLVPVISSASKIIDFACVLLLQPVTNTQATVQIEFLGNAGDFSSPCTTSGLAGGTTGPMVPTLVR